MDKIKVVKDVNYASCNNSVEIEGKCNYKGYLVSFGIDMHTMFNSSGENVGSLITFTFDHRDIKFSVKNVGIFDCDVERVFDLASRQVNSGFSNFFVSDIDLSYVKLNSNMLYDICAPSLAFDGIPYHLMLNGSFNIDYARYDKYLRNAMKNASNNPFDSNYNSKVCFEVGSFEQQLVGLTSDKVELDSIRSSTKLPISIHKYVKILYINEFTNNPSITFSRNSSLCFSPKFMLDMMESFADLYAREQGWDKYIEL